MRVRPANLEACEPPLSVPFGPRLLTDAPLLFDTKAVALDYARNMPHAGGRMGPDTDLNVGALMVPFDMMLIKTAHNFCVYTPCDHVLITHEAFIFSEFANEGTSDDSRRVVVMLQAPGDDGKVRLSGSIKPYTYDQPNAPPILHGVVPTSKPSENTTLMRIALSVVVSKKFLACGLANCDESHSAPGMGIFDEVRVFFLIKKIGAHTATEGRTLCDEDSPTRVRVALMPSLAFRPTAASGGPGPGLRHVQEDLYALVESNIIPPEFFNAQA